MLAYEICNFLYNNKLSTHLPKPHDLFGIAIVMPVDCVSLPIVHVHILHAAQYELQFSFIEIFEPLKRHDLIEAFKERFRLLFDTPEKRLFFG